MIARVIQTIFLAVGLAMVWLGFLYSYELKNLAKQEELVELEVKEEAVFETYTLANTTFDEEEDVQAVKLNKIQEPDLQVATSEERFREEPEKVEEEVYEPEEAGLVAGNIPGDFPYILAGSGLLLLLCGIASVKNSNA